MGLDEVQLQWPTKLALDPLDNTLYIVDDTMILRLTSDLKLQVVAGVSPMCTAQTNKQSNNVTKENFDVLGPIVDLDFDYDGKLYFIDKRPPKKNTVLHQIHKNRKISLNDSMGAITALAMSADGKLYLAENQLLKILTMDRILPVKNPESGNIQVTDSLSGEMYTFNRFSQHVATHSLETGAKMYTFVYNKNTALGKLSDVTDTVGNSISFQRDYAGKVKSIGNTLGQKFPVILTSMGLFQAIEFSNGEIIVDYHDSEGLLKSIRYPNGDFRLYDYDKNGHVLEVSTDTGKSISLKAKPCLDLTKNSQCVEVFSGGDLMQKIRVDQSGTVVFNEQKGKLDLSTNRTVKNVMIFLVNRKTALGKKNTLRAPL